MEYTLKNLSNRIASINGIVVERNVANLSGIMT